LVHRTIEVPLAAPTSAAEGPFLLRRPVMRRSKTAGDCGPNLAPSSDIFRLALLALT
jgi:hypothetical protein